MTVSTVTAVQMREVDRSMVEDLHIDLVQMMESAGRNLAELAMRRFRPRSTVVLAGTSGNGGGGLVAARATSPIRGTLREPCGTDSWETA